MNKILGKIVQGLSQGIYYILEFLIILLRLSTELIKSIGKMFLSLFIGGGCILLFIFLPVIIFTPTFPILLAFIAFFILGQSFVSWLEYIQYSATEFLKDYANYLQDDEKMKYKSFNEYGNQYYRMKEEEERKRREQYWEEQQKQWEERFKNFYEQSYQERQYHYPGGGYERSNNRHAGNPFDDFTRQYENAIRILGLDTDADKYEIRLQYRKLAKKYHPDISKEPDAKEKFQQINNAYDFLSDDNIERYARIKNQRRS